MRRLTVLLADLADTAPHRSVTELLRWAAPDPTVAVDVVAVHDGPLHTDLAASAPVHVVNDPGASRLVDVLQTARLGPLAERARSRDLARRLADLDAVWLADVGAARLLHWAGPARSITAHRHGSAGPIDPAGPAELDPDDRRVLVARVDRAIAGSAVAASEIADLADLSADAVTRHPDLLDPARQWPEPAEGRSARRAATRLALAADHGIAASGPLVVGSGRVDFGHGSNPFGRVCWDVHLGRPTLGAQFAWLADASTERMLGPLRREIDRAGLARSIHVIVDGPPRLEVLLAADAYLQTDAAPMDGGLADDLGTLGIAVVDRSRGDRAGADSGGERWPRTVVEGSDMAAWRDAVLAVLDPAATPPDDRTDWDVRRGGAALMEILLGDRAQRDP